MISTMCVVFGTSTSIFRHVASKSKIENWKTAVYLVAGAVIGGVVGQFLFQFVKDSSNGDVLIIIQSSILIALLIFVLIYMQLLLPKGKQMHINNFIVTIIRLIYKEKNFHSELINHRYILLTLIFAQFDKNYYICFLKQPICL